MIVSIRFVFSEFLHRHRVSGFSGRILGGLSISTTFIALYDRKRHFVLVSFEFGIDLVWQGFCRRYVYSFLLESVFGCLFEVVSSII